MFINTTQREEINVSLLAAQMQDCQSPLPELPIQQQNCLAEADYESVNVSLEKETTRTVFF